MYVGEKKGGYVFQGFRVWRASQDGRETDSRMKIRVTSGWKLSKCTTACVRVYDCVWLNVRLHVFECATACGLSVRLCATKHAFECATACVWVYDGVYLSVRLNVQLHAFECMMACIQLIKFTTTCVWVYHCMHLSVQTACIWLCKLRAFECATACIWVCICMCLSVRLHAFERATRRIERRLEWDNAQHAW